MEENREKEIIIDQDDDAASNVPARLDAKLPDKLIVFPTLQRPFFPAQTAPILLNAEMWHESVDRIAQTPHKLAGLMMVKSPPGDLPVLDDIPAVGTVVRVHNPVAMEGHIQLLAEGLKRFRVKRWIKEGALYIAEVEYPDPPNENSKEIRAYALAIINTIKELLPLNPLYKENVRAFLERFNPDDASPLTDFAAALTSAESEVLQDVLETLPLLRRMEKVMLLIQHELEVAGLQTEIRQRVEERISDQQREFFLKEQLKEIQKELGISKDDKTVERERFEQRLADCVVPEEAQKRIDDELQKFSFLDVGSPEYAVTRNYLDTLTALPWGKYSDDKLDLKYARQVMDEDHEGLDDVKDRMLEFLAVGVLKGEIAGSILLLVGPPGVGKTSIGRSVADALGRKYYRFSVGGMRDEAEIKGHRRTYIGAMPGKFIQALRESGVSNPVIMLDEIDKIGSSYQGDPASALLEVLDPEQNVEFLDHYLDVRFDLSKVLFICTANQLDSIPRPLLDRMEVIRLSGYLAEEKFAIAKKHLWPKQRKKAGLKANQIRLHDTALRRIIEDYAREAGVRSLEKQLGRIARKTVVKILNKGQKKAQKKATKITIAAQDLATYLGPPLFRKHRPIRQVGVVTGLAWTSLGGVTLDVEASLVHSKHRGFKITGQLGDVMKESAEIAYSYISANLEDYHGNPAFFDQAFVHLHVPEGATPKDGPSAGVTMATALLSLARNQRLKRPIAMTGELTLTGRILAVGGIREKLVAAKRVGIKEIILPEHCRGEFEELPAFIGKGLSVHFVERYEEVVKIVFG